MTGKLRRRLSALLVTVMLAAAALAEGADINGKWVAPLNREGRSATITMNLTVAETTLKGTITTPFGDEMEIENGTIEDGKVSFDAHGKAPNGMQIAFHYSGEVEGDAINLNMEVNGHQKGPALKFHRSEK
jgi:hypothetical protein